MQSDQLRVIRKNKVGWNRRHGRLRSAMMLVELAGLMAIVAAIMSLSAVVVQQAFRAHRDALRHIRQTEQLQQIVQRWRQDVHSATQVDLLIDNGTEILLTLSQATASEQQISYRTNATGLARELRREGSVISSDQWTLSDLGRMLFSIDTSGERMLVKCRLEVAEESPLPSSEWCACAAVAVSNADKAYHDKVHHDNNSGDDNQPTRDTANE